MVLRPTRISDLAGRIDRLNAGDVAALSRIATLDTDTEEFGEIIAKNPKLALAAKGIDITDEQAVKIKDQIASAARGPGDLASSEIGVTVKHKF